LRAGIRTIIIPEKNKKDLPEIPKNVKRKIEFIPVGQMDKVLSIAMGELKKKSGKKGRKESKNENTGG